MRPGATRLSLPSIGTTLSQEEYVIDAIRWVATHGWKFLHVYRCNHRSGEWRHKSRPGAPLGTRDRRWLSHYRMTNRLDNKGGSAVRTAFRPGDGDGEKMGTTNGSMMVEIGNCWSLKNAMED